MKVEEKQMEYVTLNNDVKMPQIGFGTINITDPQEAEEIILNAIEAGYRLFDTAQGYGNERQVGAALKKSPVPRSELFITTKLWLADATYEKAKLSIQGSLDRLQLDYIDLFLIHHPFNDIYGAYRALTEFYKAGKIKAIGVSNLYPDRLIDFVKFNEVTPQVNQVEIHLLHQQDSAIEIMNKYHVQAQAWGPLARANKAIFENDYVVSLAEKYQKTIGQIALRFLVQKGVALVMKTTKKERMLENIDVFNFSLSDEEMNELKKLDTGASIFLSHKDPAQVERFAGWERKY